MKWQKVEYPSHEEWKEFLREFEREHGFKYTRKPRYFVDENLGPGTTELLETWGANVTDVSKAGLQGHPDESIWSFARKEKRIILSHDDDFMDHRKYPIRQCHGLAVFPHKGGGESPLIRELRHFLDLMAGGAGFLYQCKLNIRENGHWELTHLGERGRIESVLYDLNDLNHVFQLMRET